MDVLLYKKDLVLKKNINTPEKEVKDDGHIYKLRF